MKKIERWIPFLLLMLLLTSCASPGAFLKERFGIKVHSASGGAQDPQNMLCSDEKKPNGSDSSEDPSASAPQNSEASGLDQPLSQIKGQLYQEIETQLLSGAETLLIRDPDFEAIASAYHQVLQDHPELFWLSESFTYRRKIVLFQEGYELTPYREEADAEELVRQQQELEAAVQALYEGMERETGLPAEALTDPEQQYQQLFYLYTQLIVQTQYALDLADPIRDGELDEKFLIASTAYGCLVEHKALCSGYSAALQLILNRIGIECSRVTGTSLDGTAHEWNRIRLGGEDYYADVTWDDPVSDRETGLEVDFPYYPYFMITTQVLEKTHIPDTKTQTLPSCTATRFNYYVHEGRYLQNYSFDAVCSILEDCGRENQMLRFGSDEALQEACQELIEESGIFRISGYNDSILYQVDTDALILILVKQ